jgi:hypothetical protein
VSWKGEWYDKGVEHFSICCFFFFFFGALDTQNDHVLLGHTGAVVVTCLLQHDCKRRKCFMWVEKCRELGFSHRRKGCIQYIGITVLVGNVSWSQIEDVQSVQ